MSKDRIIIEAKEDQERFKDWIGLDKINGKTVGEIYWDKFASFKQRIKSPYNDLYWWMKNSTPEKFKEYIDDLGIEVANKQNVKQKEKDGARLVYKDNNWKVYEITTYEASAKYGKNTKWCISGSKEWTSPNQGGQQFFDGYYNQNGIRFYFFINNKDEKWALAVYPNNEYCEIFNAEDVKVAYIPNAPEIPEIKVKYNDNSDSNILVNAIMSGQLNEKLLIDLMADVIIENTGEMCSIFNHPDDMVYFVEEYIPEGYLEYEAVESGAMTPEEYEEITGEEYTEGGWDGDIPAIDLDDIGSFDTKDEYLDRTIYEAHKYWVCFETGSGYGYEVYNADDWVHLYLLGNDLCRFQDWPEEDVADFYDNQNGGSRADMLGICMANLLIDKIKKGEISKGDIENIGLSQEYLASLGESLKESEWTPDKINAREKENQDRIDALTEQDILDWCKRDKVATGFAENGPSIIFTSGEVYNFDKYKYHMKGLLNLFKGKGGYRYGPSEPGDWSVMEQILNKCEKEFGIVTTNLGRMPGLESRCKVVALKKPTERQYEKITDFLDAACMKKKQVIVYLGDKGQQTYYFINDTSDDIIKKIKKAYAFGRLEESREDFFKNSVVRDASGNLLPVYHCSFSEFDTFAIDDEDGSLEGSDWSGEFGFAWFAEDENYAQNYGDGEEYECYLNITKPLDIGELNNDVEVDNGVEIEDDFYDSGITTVSHEFIRLCKLVKVAPEVMIKYYHKWWETGCIYDITRRAFFKNIIVSLGYDGVVATEGGNKTWGCVRANQVKLTSNENPTERDSMKESLDGVDIYTAQGKEVLDILKSGKTYVADYDKIEFDYKDEYRKLAELNGFTNCPIFAVPAFNTQAITSSSSDARDVLLHLRVPRNAFRCHEYYDWSDYIFYSNGGGLPEENPEELMKELEELISQDLDISSVDTPELILNEIKPEWLVGVEDMSILEEDLSKEQEDFFKDSVIRNSKGELIPMWHGTNVEFKEFKSPINWFSTSKEYAKQYAEWLGGTPTYYEAYLNCKKPFNCGNTSARVFDLIPNKLSRESTAICRKLGIDEDDFRRLIKQTSASNKEEEYKLKLHTIVRLGAFAQIVKNSGYDSIFTIEEGHPCVGVLNPEDIKRVNNLKPTSSKNINEEIVPYKDTGIEPNFTQEDILAYAKNDPDHITFGLSEGASVVLSDGTVINVTAFDTHGLFAGCVYSWTADLKELGVDDFGNPNEPDWDSDADEDAIDHMYSLGVVTLNDGTSWLEERRKVVFEGKPTERQLEVIRDFIDMIQMKSKASDELYVYSGTDFQRYKLGDYTSDEIIDKIKRSYVIGRLEESDDEDNDSDDWDDDYNWDEYNKDDVVEVNGMYEVDLNKIDLSDVESLFSGYLTTECDGMNGPVYIFPDGTFLDIMNDYGDRDSIHYDIAFDVIGNFYNVPSDIEENSVGSVMDCLESYFGMIRCNGGEGNSEDRTYVAIGKQPTADQYEALEKYFYNLWQTLGKSNVSVNIEVSGFKSATFEFDKIQPEGIIKAIKRYFVSGQLLNEKNYKLPTKTYDFDGDKVVWDKDAEDYIYWGSEADKWAEDYAKSYKVQMSPKDFLDLTTQKGADSLKKGDNLGLGELRDLDKDEFNKWIHQPIFLQIAFRDKNHPQRAQVTGHEGRHRMFALMQAGYKSVDVELSCEVWDTSYDKYHPFKADSFQLIGQFNKNVMVQVYNPIPLSWKQHKSIRPELKDENLNEYLDKVDYKDDSDKPVYATDSTYQLKNLLTKGDKAYRIYNDDGTYYFQDASGNKTHYDMIYSALKNGWLADSKLRDGDDDPTSGTIFPEDFDEGYMVFIPFNYGTKLRYHTKLGEDSYYDCRVYPFGVMFVRSQDAYSNGLFSALGQPTKEIHYETYDETVTVNDGNNTRDFDVELELEDDPNNAISNDVMNMRPREEAEASRDERKNKNIELMKKHGVPENFYSYWDNAKGLFYVMNNYDLPKDMRLAIAKYLNEINDSKVPHIEFEESLKPVDPENEDMDYGAIFTENVYELKHYIDDCIAHGAMSGLRVVYFKEDGIWAFGDSWDNTHGEIEQDMLSKQGADWGANGPIRLMVYSSAEPDSEMIDYWDLEMNIYKYPGVKICDLGYDFKSTPLYKAMGTPEEVYQFEQRQDEDESLKESKSLKKSCKVKNKKKTVKESFKQLDDYDELYYTNSVKELLDYLDTNGYTRFVYFRPEDLYLVSDNYIHDDMGKIGRSELGCNSTEYCFIYSSGHGMADNDLECDSGWIYVYPNFEIFDRDNGFKKTSLYKYLGEPLRVDEFDDIGESLKEENEDSDEFDSITKVELESLNKWLDKYGFEVELITDKETLDDIDWSSQYGDEAVGMFLADVQDNASVFPIALNKKVISELCKDKDDLIRGIKGTLWHEAGHGIYRFLKDIIDMPEDEEDCVEEFARYREVSELFDILKNYMKQNESLKEEADDKDIYYRGYDSRYGVFDSDNEYGQLYTWVTDEPEYALEYAENNEYGKVAKVRITCSDDKIGGVLDLPEDVDYYDPGDEEFQECILDQGLKGYGFEAGDYDDYCICISKDCVEVIDPDVKVEVEEESLKESVIPLEDCPTDIIIGNVDFTQYVKNKINNIDLRVFYDTSKDWYLVAPAYNSIHDDIIEDAINAGYYDAKNYDAEFTGYDLTKLSEFASYIHKQGKPFVICTDIENPEDIYPHQYKLDIEGTIVYALSYYNLRELDFINNNLIEVLKEEFINESKADQQKFIDKFGEQRWTLFNTLKARLVNKDIYYWLKKTEDELDDELRRVASQKTNKEVRSEAKSGATLIDEDENWKAYRIDTYEASKYYGYGTQWCISSAENAVNIFDIYGETSEAAIQDLEDSYPVVKVLSIHNSGNNYWEIEAELEPYYYFDEYSEDSDIYFFIAKPENKECFESDQWCKVAYVAETDTFYDAEDMDYEPRNHGSNFKALPQSLQDFYKERMGLFESLNLNESKQDIEKFRQWAGDELANRFFAVKNRLKGELKDIYYWISLEKKLGPNKELAHQNALDSLEYAITDVEVTPTKKERQELAKNGSEKIYEDERWLVLKINSFEASVKYGKHTQWCITGTNSGMDGGRSDWNYHSDNDMYFFIDKQKDTKYALEFKDMHNWCLYNDQDYVEVGEGDIAQEAVNVLGDPWSTEYDTHYPAFPKIEGLPDLQQAYKDVIAEEGADDKSIKVESLNEDLNVLDALDKEFGQEELYMWSTYILPNGHFLNPDNAQDYWDEVDEEPIYEHCDFEDWAYQKGYNLSDIYNNCIKMNVTYPYLSMPDKAKPTQEQLNAIRKILSRKDLFEPEGKFYWYDIFPEDKVDSKGENLLAVYTPVGDELFDLDVSDADDIVRAINQAYIRGGFFTESLNESKADWEKFRQWCNDDTLYNRFVKSQKRFEGKYKDIYYWMGLEKKYGKHGAIQELQAELRNIEETPTAKEKAQLAKDGTTLLYNGNGWKVFQIDTYEASRKYGKGTNWCISGDDMGYDYFGDYHDSGDRIIFFIKDDDTKYAVVIDGNYWTIYDGFDNIVSHIPGAPKVDGVPDVSKIKDDVIRAIVQLYNVKPSEIDDVKSAFDDSEMMDFFWDYDTREAYAVTLKNNKTKFMYFDGPQAKYVDVTDEFIKWVEEYM